jgi:hypothetical protein
MRKSNSGYVGQAIERVLEFSAEAQIVRCKTGKDSAAFHRLTGAIAAYAKTLAILTALQQREEFLTVVAQSELPKQGPEVKNAQVQGPVGLDLLLATANQPTLTGTPASYPAPAEIAAAPSDRVEYFRNNVRAGIRTFEDARIEAMLEG